MGFVGLVVLSLFYLTSAFGPLGKQATQGLDRALSRYERLQATHLSHTVIRGRMPRPEDNLRQLDFSVLGRDFRLYLSPSRKIFHSHFKAVVVDANSTEVPIDVDLNEYYRGHVYGENGSMVSAHLSRAGVLTAYVRTPSQLYFIEPSEHHISEPHPFQMIAYRGSDVRHPIDPRAMDFIVPPVENSTSNLTDWSAPYFGDPRTTRQAISSSTWTAGDSCSLILVADYRFFLRYGANSGSVITKLVSILDAIDVETYRPTVWTLNINRQTVSNLGLVIKKIMIHTAYTSTYNAQAAISDASVLLNDFNTGDGKGNVWDDYCLAHLFTYRVLDNGLLGLSNIASPSASTTGGICSTKFVSSTTGTWIIYNTALSSYTSANNPLVFVEEVLVTAHEIGHSWGSYHDPATTPSCGSVYIMNQYAQDGSLPTNKMFSSCSITSIGAVLNSKARLCFTNRGTGICGDYVVTSGEQCDAGLLGDLCCTQSCTLKPNTMCSDANSLCCKGCQVADSSVVCQLVSTLTVDCTTNVTCDGANTSCPSRLPQAPENTSCVAGICKEKDGRVQCLQYCELRGQQQCFCTGNNSCQLCCQDVSTNGSVAGACAPYSISTPLGDGVVCPEGSCRSGLCVSQTQDNINKLFAFLDSLDINAFREFLSVNIVGTVLFFSTVLWCILGLVIHFCFDKKINVAILEELKAIEKRVKNKMTSVEEQDQGTSLLPGVTEEEETTH